MNDINLDKIKVNYDKQDFLYYKYAYDIDKKTELYKCENNSIADETELQKVCDRFKLQDGPCSVKFAADICNNKKLADEMLQATVNHSGADELYKNTTSKYNLERLIFLNLGIGIIIKFVYILLQHSFSAKVLCNSNRVFHHFYPLLRDIIFISLIEQRNTIIF